LLQAGRREEAERIFEDVERQSSDGYVAPTYMGLLYTAFGRADEALAAFEEALELRDPNVLWIMPSMAIAMRNLVEDPRWPDLIARISLALE